MFYIVCSAIFAQRSYFFTVLRQQKTKKKIMFKKHYIKDCSWLNDWQRMEVGPSKSTGPWSSWWAAISKSHLVWEFPLEHTIERWELSCPVVPSELICSFFLFAFMICCVTCELSCLLSRQTFFYTVKLCEIPSCYAHTLNTINHLTPTTFGIFVRMILWTGDQIWSTLEAKSGCSR